jgi:hypothetical protein
LLDILKGFIEVDASVFSICMKSLRDSTIKKEVDEASPFTVPIFPLAQSSFGGRD